MDAIFRTARELKDRNFDGKFFFAVKTTGIFCRPSCPSPVAKEENVLYFSNMFEALEHGFRPCLRCRPDIYIDYYRGNLSGTLVVTKALQMIYDGYLHEHSINDMAITLSLSERHLRKLFVDTLGMSPGKINRYHRVLFAKKLLLYSSQPITDVAFASGFGSLRQFNDVFKSALGMTPSAYRKMSKKEEVNNRPTTLQIKYKKQFDFGAILSFLNHRAIKGVENVSQSTYSRTFRTESSSGFFSVKDNQQQSCLELVIDCDDLRCYMTVYNKVRRMFDVDTDFTSINAQFCDDQFLSGGMVNDQVPHLPVAFDSFEVVIRAILGQQISVKAATTLVGRIVRQAGIKCNSVCPPGLESFFPTPEELIDLKLDNLGITKTRQETLRTVTQAVIDNVVDLSPNQTFETFHTNFSALKGIGDWTSNYVAMRGLGMMDCYPYNDLGVIKALTVDKKVPTKKEIIRIGETWRPYRTYATLCLWNQLKGDG